MAGATPGNTESRPAVDYPHSWIAVSLALVGLTVGAGVALASIVQFLTSRPFDFRGPSDEITAVMEETLLANRIPAENIVRMGPETRTSDRAVWHYYEYDVVVPEVVSLSGMEKVISKVLLDRSADLSDYYEGGQKRGCMCLFWAAPWPCFV